VNIANLGRMLAGALLAGALWTGGAAAGPAADLLQAEHAALGDGASSLWRAQDIGGSDIGGVRGPERSGPRDISRKLKAGFLSLLLPGAGQLYNGDRSKALIFAGAEAAVWTSYAVFHFQAEGLSEDYRDYAGIFAGTAGDHTETYWRAVGRYMTSDEYNEDLERQARAEQTEPTGLIIGDDAWFWRSERYLENYQLLRADANRAYDRRDFTVLFALVNRAVAVYDAVRGAGGGEHMLEVAGLGFDVESRRVIGRRGTACVFSCKF
jgi:hypothetical protein